MSKLFVGVGSVRAGHAGVGPGFLRLVPSVFPDHAGIFRQKVPRNSTPELVTGSVEL
jgi:hypothetical protein